MKTHGGPKRHQRSCGAIIGLDKDALMDIAQEIDASLGLHDDVWNDNEQISDLGDTKVKSGIKLPTSESQWGTANAFFHASLPTCDISNDLNAACKRLSGGNLRLF